jgi:hypothetical protein
VEHYSTVRYGVLGMVPSDIKCGKGYYVRYRRDAKCNLRCVKGWER